jgi:chromosomal replication initiator protein
VIESKDKFALFSEKGTTKEVSSDRKAALSGDEKAKVKWAECLEIIKDNINEQAFSSWFAPIVPLRIEGNTLIVQVPSQFFYEWIEEHYYDLLRNSLTRVMGSKVNLQYEVVIKSNNDDTLESRTIRVPAFRHNNGSQGAINFAEQNKQQEEFVSGLNPRYHFDNFVVGDNNQLAYSAADAIAKKPGGTSFNPLFIYSKTGLGKTHLIQAIGNEIEKKNPKMKVRYTSSDRFTMEFITSIQNNSVNEFVNFYRGVDVLIVDDIQFFSSKEKTQDNFFHTFNALHQSGKQIILASDKSPKELVGLDERLISRFQWGLSVDIQKPDLETRMAILQKKALNEGIELTTDVLHYIAENVTSSIRELEGSLISLIAKVTLDKKDISLALAKEVVAGVAKLENREITMEDIKKTVSNYYNITIEGIESKSRKHEIALSRQLCMHIAKKLTNLSLKSIGAHFGGRDHSTVLHSCRAIDNYLETDKKVKSDYDKIVSELKR